MDVMRAKVFGLGLSKTGTTTLGGCLERLGYAHFSWNEPFAKRVLRGDVEHALEVADRFESFDDLPWPVLFQELDARFPRAKFVLTVRNSSNDWYESMLRHAEHKGATEVRRRVYGSEIPHGHRTEHIDAYERHNDAVRAHFADRPEKLLEVCWSRDPGWRPLCNFLGLPVPDGDIPHRNKRRSLKLKHVRRRISYSVAGAISKIT